MGNKLSTGRNRIRKNEPNRSGRSQTAANHHEQGPSTHQAQTPPTSQAQSLSTPQAQTPPTYSAQSTPIHRIQSPPAHRAQRSPNHEAQSSSIYQGPCTLCEVFLSVAQRSGHLSTLGLSVFQPLVQDSKLDTECDIKIDQQSLLSLLRDRLVGGQTFDRWLGTGNLVDPEALVLHSACSGRLVPPSIRYDIINSWLRDCFFTHGSSCDVEHAPSAHLYVIDCTTNRVVLLPPKQKYVTLSYVCGPAVSLPAASFPRNGEKRAHKLESMDFPLTVKDAIHVAQQIGHRYLWVDSYCIPQGDAEQKRIAILNMNKVYSGSELTIMALEGANIRAGLPGVSSCSRSGGIKQFVMPGAEMVGTLPHFTDVVQQSIWASRAWCYQEARLSRRCLFFTKYQVYFSCQEETRSEALEDQTQPPTDSRQLEIEGLTPRTFLPSDIYKVKGMFLDRLVYTQKSFTYQNDALNAFRGLLARSPYTTFWGVPVTRQGLELDPHVQFAMGLLWYRLPVVRESRYLSKRRAGFPTWSWTSVTGAISQIDPDNVERSHYRNFLAEQSRWQFSPVVNVPGRLSPSFQVEVSTSSQVMSLKDLLNLHASAGDTVLPETTKSLTIHGDIVTFRRSSPPDSRYIYYSYQNNSENPSDESRVQSRVLLQCAFDTDAAEEDFPEQEHNLQDALVLVEWCDNAPVGRIQFILMLIKWVDEHTAERIGILRNYSTSTTLDFTRSLPRRRKRFQLR